MNRHLFLIIVMFALAASDTAHGQETETAAPSAENTPALSERSAQDIAETLKNPFIPQLPLPEPEPIIYEEEVKATPTPTPRATPGPIIREQPKEIPKPNFTISGLVWNTDQPQAIVNNNVVDIGDYVGQWRIIQIEKKGITVQYHTQQYFIEPEH